nr:HEAT repeat domain-containing protein [Hymenobacter radiodurans]
MAKLATTDSSVQVRAAALTALGALEEKRYAKLFTKALESKSYRVQGAALQALLPLEPKQALARATAFEADNKGALTVALVSVYGQAGGQAQWPLVLRKFDAAEPNAQFDMLAGMVPLLGRLEDPSALSEGIKRMKDLAVKFKAYGVAEPITRGLRQIEQQQAARPTAAEAKSLVDAAVKEIQDAK